MRYRNDLQDTSLNSAFEVVTPFEAFVEVGLVDSNYFIGRSMIRGRLYAETRLEWGATILDLAGGVFLVDGDLIRPVVPTVPERWPFEARNRFVVWPVESLLQVRMPTQVPTVAGREERLTLEEAVHGGYVQRGVDWIRSGPTSKSVPSS